MPNRKTLLLVNLGTPDDPNPRAVGKYLNEFLMDPRVIDKPWWFRFLLVKLIIVPIRKFKSSEAYKKVWRKEGSPPKVFTKALADDLQLKLGSEWDVRWAMRYGNPSLSKALSEIENRKETELYLLPLYPQETKSSTGTVIHVLSQWRETFLGKVKIFKPFYNQPEFLDSYAQIISEKLEMKKEDRLLFSFHGLPERHIREIDPSEQHCLVKNSCCESINEYNSGCYRAQCFETARQMAKRLKLNEGQWFVSFQSRLGREPWIQPFTDKVLEKWYDEPHRRTFVTCPAFVCDCLETLEEIGIRAREGAEAKGCHLELLPALNNHPYWVDQLALAIQQNRWSIS